MHCSEPLCKQTNPVEALGADTGGHHALSCHHALATALNHSVNKPTRSRHWAPTRVAVMRFATTHCSKPLYVNKLTDTANKLTDAAMMHTCAAGTAVTSVQALSGEAARAAGCIEPMASTSAASTSAASMSAASTSAASANSKSSEKTNHCSTAEPKSEPQRGEDEAEDENDDADDAGRDHGDEDDQQPHVRAREKEHTAHE